MSGIRIPMIKETFFLFQSDVTEAPFFATPIILGKNGLEKNLGLGKLTDFEKDLLKGALPELQGSIKKGVEFAAKFQ